MKKTVRGERIELGDREGDSQIQGERERDRITSIYLHVGTAAV
jgi:hypothetical protein